jgi:SOS-response transcriptional repressor LexA
MTTTTTATEPTAAQRRVYAAVLAHLRDTGRPPTIRDIADRLGQSGTHAVVRHLDALAARGMLRAHFGSRGFGVPDIERMVQAEAGRLIDALTEGGAR